MADVSVSVEATLKVDASKAQSELNSLVNNAKNQLNNVKMTVEVDDKGAQQKIQGMANAIKSTPIKLPVEIDTGTMATSLGSFQKQIDKLKKEVEEAGGVIKKMQISPYSKEGVWPDENGKEVTEIEECYHAVVQYQTAVGETIEKVMDLNTATGEFSESTSKMTVDFEKQRKDVSQLSSQIEEYTSKLEALKEKSKSLLVGTTESNPFKALVDSIDFSSVSTMDDMDAMINKFKQAQAEFDNFNASVAQKKLAGSAIEQIGENLAKIPNELSKIQAKVDTLDIVPDDLTAKIQTIQEGLTNIERIRENGSSKEYVDQYNQIANAVASAKAQTDLLVDSQKKSAQAIKEQQRAQDQLNSLVARYQATESRYSAFKSDPALTSEYEALGNTINSLQTRMQTAKDTGVWDKTITQDISSANAQLSQFNNHVIAAGKNSKSFMDRFKDSLGAFGSFLSATTLITKGIQGLKKAVSSVKELDKAMVDLKKVTNETDESYDRYLQNVGKQAQQIGSTMTDLISSGATFAKLGYSFDDAQGLAQVATIFSNVGDFSNIEVATSGLITAMKSFYPNSTNYYSDAMAIADKINEVANNFAVSADDLTTGLANSGSALSLAGNSIDQSIAMITAMSEITQNASESGNALKILSMRLRGAKADLESAGESTDGMCDSVSTLREKVRGLTGGVDIMADEAGTKFKSTYQIMQDISEVWDDMTDINQAALLETIAGKMRGNSISALLTNMSQANKVLNTSLNSAGSAMEEHSRWMDSIEAKQATMNAAWQDFSDSLINTGVIKGWYDGLTGILNVGTDILDTFGSIPTVMGLITSALGIGGKGLLGVATNSNGQLIGRIGQATTDDFKNYGFAGGLTSILNGSINTSILDAYSNALNGGATSAEALSKALVNADGSIKSVNVSTALQLKNMGATKDELESFGASTSKITAKTLGLSVAQTALNTAISVGTGLLVSFVASKAMDWLSDTINGVTEQTKALDQLKQEYGDLSGDYKSVQNEIDGTNRQLETTKDRIEELQNKGKLSFVEQQELENLQKQNVEYEQRIKYLKELADIKGSETRQNIISQYNTDMKTSGEYATPLDRFITDIGGVLVPNAQDYAQELKQSWPTELEKLRADALEMSKLAEQGYNDYQKYELAEQLAAEKLKNATSENREALSLEYEDAKKNLSLAKQYNDYRASIIEAQEKLTNYRQQYLDFGGSKEASIVKEWDSLIDEFNSLLDPDKYKQQKISDLLGLDEYKNTVENIQRLANEGKLDAEVISSYEDFAQALSSVGVSAEEAAEHFNSLVTREKDAAKQVLSASAIQAQYLATESAAKDAIELFSEQGYSGSLTAVQYEKLIELGEEYAACVDNSNGYIALNIDKLNALKQAQYEEQKAAVAASKAQAKIDYAENIKAINELQAALEMAEKLNVGDNVTKQLKLQISGLQFDNEGLLSEVHALDLLQSQLEYATSSYKKWLDARQLPEADDTYVSLLTAMQDISDGLESGRIGTQAYKSAVDLLIPDGEDVQKYMKNTLGRYITEGSKGLQNLIDDMYKQGFTVKNADGNYSFADGTTVEGIAKGLNLTTEAAEHALLALEAYGWEVNLLNKDLNDSSLMQQYEDALVDMASAEKRLADAKQAAEDAGDIKAKAAAQKELAEATLAVADAKEKVQEAGVAAGVLEEVPELTGIEKLKQELEELQTAYDTLKEFKLTGDIDPNFEAYAGALKEAVETAQKIPEGGFDLSSLQNIDVSEASSNIQKLNEGLAGIQGLVSAGLVTPEQGASMSETLTQALNDCQAVLDTFSETNAEPITLTVEQEGAEDAQSAIQAAADGPYSASIEVEIDPESKAAIEQQFSEWQQTQEKLRTEPAWNSEENGPPSPYGSLTAKDVADLNDAYTEASTAVKGVSEEYKDAAQKALEYSKAAKEAASAAEEVASTPTPTPTPSPTPAPQQSGPVIPQQVIVQTDTSQFEKDVSKIDPEPVEVPIEADTTSLESAIELLNQVQSAMHNNPIGGLEGAMSDVGTSIEEVMTAINTVQEACGQPLIITADASEAIAEAESFIGAWDGQQIMMFILGDASSAISTASAAASQISGMSATFTIRGVYIPPSNMPTSNTVNVSGATTKLAKGTHYAKEEDAIVGEAGVETWIHGDRFYTVGHNGPELIHLSRGDQVLTAQETKQLFGGKKRIAGNAYASGIGNMIAVAAAVVTAGIGLAKTIGNTIASGGTTTTGGGTTTTGNGKITTSGGGGNIKTNGGSSGGDSSNNNYNSGGGGGGGSSNASDTNTSSSNSDKDTSDYVDWIETALENQKRITDEFIKFSEKAVGYSDKNSELQKAMGNINEEISLNQRANERYLQQADRIAKEENLSASIVEKIKNGTIDINKYDDDTRKAISSYQKWYDLAQDCLDTITDLKDQQYELATQKMDNIIQHYENRINLLGVVFDSYQNQIDKKIADGKEVVKGDYAEMISNTEQQISLLEEERNALTSELNTLVRAGTIKVGSDDWFEYTSKINEFSNSIDAAELSLSEFQDNVNEISLNNLKIALDTIEYAQETIQGLLDLRSAQGKTATAGDYRDLISASSRQIKNLQTQNAELRKQQIGLDILSEKYQEIQEQINENEKSILSAKTKQEEWNDAIVDLQIQKLQKQNKEYQSQLDLMDAIEELEKEKQRRALVYHEGIGFTYEAPNDGGVQSAQRNLENLLLERRVEQLEASKADSNLYDDFGNELIPITDTLPGLDLSAYYNSVLGSRENSSLLASALGSFNIGNMIANGAAAKDLSVVIESGAIQLSGVQDVNELAEAITYQLPNALLQQLYK